MKAKSNPESFEKPSKDNFFIRLLNRVADSKGWEILFQVLLYGFLIWALYNLKLTYDFHTHPEWANVPKYSIYDFKYGIMLLPVFFLYKRACHYMFFDWVKSILNPVTYPTDEDKNKRAKNACIWISNIIYYSFSTLSAFFLFKDEFFFPKQLGGTGGPNDLGKYLPGKVDFPHGVTFYMIQFGSHFYTFIDYTINRWKDPKFWEMFLHHSITVFLIFFSYMTNNLPVGILVLFVHDPSDIFFCVNRILVDMKNSTMPVKATGVGIFLASWIFFRLYAFPKCIISASFDFIYYNDSGRLYSAYLFMTLMLSALLILHIYWLILILKAMGNMLKGKTNYNHYDADKKKTKA